MGDEYLDTISETESDEFIKSSVDNLVPNPSESEDDNECDVPACDDFTTFSNLLFDADDDFSYNPHSFNVESDLIESLLNHDSSIISSSSSKIDSLLDEFVGELILLKSIPPGIDKADCDPEEEIRLIEKLLYDNSSPRPPKEFISKNSDAAIESFSPLHILVKDRLISNNSLSLYENESFHFDIPSSLRPPTKPPDDDSRILTVNMVESLRTHDSSLIILSKIDSLFDEFADELTLLKLIPSGIDETDYDFEEYIRLIEKLLYDNSSPRPSEEFVFANSDAETKSFSPS
nr:hypothetical protein [Tanacetum cinerariifolium]